MYLKAIYLILIYLVSFMTHAAWTPSQPVDPSKILYSAVEDRKSGNYLRALEKHIWFHHEALKHEQAFYGVRLSFALSYWVDLAKEYEPALVALEKEAAEAEVKMKRGTPCSRNDFHDFVSIHRELGRIEPVLDLFKYFDVEDPKFAAQNIDLAGPFLIKAEEYALYAKYLDPEKDFERAREFYEMNTEMAKDPKYGRDFLDYSVNSYIERVTTLIALLAVTGKQEVAAEIAERSLMVMNSDRLNKRVKSALDGEVPKPWL